MDRADVVGRVPAGATVLVTETAGGWVLVTYVGDGVSITGWPPKHLLY